MKPGREPCQACCECPSVILRTAARAAFLEKVGFIYIPWPWPYSEEEEVYPPVKRYLRREFSGQIDYSGYSYPILGYAEMDPFTGGVTVDRSGTVVTVPGGPDVDAWAAGYFWVLSQYGGVGWHLQPGPSVGMLSVPLSLTEANITLDLSFGIPPFPDYGARANLVEPYTDKMLIANLYTLVNEEDYGGYVNDGGSGGELISTALYQDNTEGEILHKKFRFRHKASKVGVGCYKVLYDLVTIMPVLGPDVDGITSDDLLGGFTPGSVHEVTISEPDTGARAGLYIQATATATANAQGFLEIAITNPGAGYGPSATASVAGFRLYVHLAGAVGDSYQWDGEVPESYDPLNPATWPESPEVIPDFPTIDEDDDGEDGFPSVVIMNLRSRCRGCS